MDVVAYNNYPVWGGQKEPIPAWEIACGLDYMRGTKGSKLLDNRSYNGSSRTRCYRIFTKTKTS